MKVKEYTIVNGLAADVEHQVSELLNAGWEIYGEPMGSLEDGKHFVIHQPMILITELEPTEYD